MGVSRKRLELRIERLVFQGNPGVDPRAVARAIERELARAVAAGGLPPGLEGTRRIERLAAGDVRLAPGGSAADAGTGIAHSVYRGLKR